MGVEVIRSVTLELGDGGQTPSSIGRFTHVQITAAISFNALRPYQGATGGIAMKRPSSSTAEKCRQGTVLAQIAYEAAR